MKYLLALGTILMFASSAAGVCNVPQPRLVCAEYFASKVVVEATLIGTKDIGDKDDPGGTLAFEYSLRADHVIRGQISEVFRVYEGNDSGRAIFGWKTGQKYLLFLFYSSSDKSWELDGCGNSGLLSGAKAVLEQIKKIQTVHQDGGIIHGVVNQSAWAVPFPKVRVDARGAHGVFKATTDKKGEFEIKVPAGRYIVRITSNEGLSETDVLSYENPGNIRIEPGGCVQIQLEARASAR